MGVLLLALSWSQVQFQDTHSVVLELNLEARVRDRLSVSKCRPEYADRQDTGGACHAKFNHALHRTSHCSSRQDPLAWLKFAVCPSRGVHRLLHDLGHACSGSLATHVA